MTDLERLDGLHVGLLSDDERRDFEAACREGRARRRYEGTSGFLGLAKVQLIREPEVGDD